MFFFLLKGIRADSANSFSCWDQIKCLIALPTDLEQVMVFEKTIGEFSCVNNRLAFDMQIVLNDNENEKVVFDLLIDGKKQTKRI